MELLRVITLDVGGRPSVAIDLGDQSNYSVVRESFSVEPASKQQIMSSADRRYGGSRQVGETTDNGAVGWSALVSGASADACLVLVESMIAQLESNPLARLFEWRADGASQSSLYDIRGTAAIKNKYLWAQFSGVQSWVFELSIPIAPLARGLPMDIRDIFAVDTRSDYSYDSGASANEEVVGGVLKAAANVNTENRAIHTARGYSYGDNQQTIKGAPKATISGWKLGVEVKRTAANTYLEVYVDDDGTNSRLRIDKIVAGVRGNLKSTNLAARVANGVAHWVRGRIEGNVVTAEYFTAAPTPMGAPTTTNTQTLAAGADQEAFGAGVKGAPGRVWVPKAIGAELDEYAVEPYTYRNLTLPQTIPLAGSIPGDAPALADVTVTPSGGAAAPIWALLGWSKKPGAGLAAAPFGIIEAETAGNLSGWASVANGEARGGNMLNDTAPVSTDVYTASWPVDPSLMVADAFASEIAIEVWARVIMDPLLVTPSLTLSARPEDGLSYGAARYTDEWGSGGKLLTLPITSTRFRMTRLGTLRLLVDPLRPRKWMLWLTGSLGAGSAGAWWGVDYLILVPSSSRACSPSSKVNDGSYPQFVAGVGETSKTIRADLSALVAKPPAYGHPDHGLGGQLLELPPGEDELLAKLSSLVPDDPTANVTNEQSSHPATIHAAITPRWYLTRSS